MPDFNPNVPFTNRIGSPEPRTQSPESRTQSSAASPSPAAGAPDHIQALETTRDHHQIRVNTLQGYNRNDIHVLETASLPEHEFMAKFEEVRRRGDAIAADQREIAAYNRLIRSATNGPLRGMSADMKRLLRAMGPANQVRLYQELGENGIVGWIRDVSHAIQSPDEQEEAAEERIMGRLSPGLRHDIDEQLENSSEMRGLRAGLAELGSLVDDIQGRLSNLLGSEHAGRN